MFDIKILSTYLLTSCYFHSIVKCGIKSASNEITRLQRTVQDSILEILQNTITIYQDLILFCKQPHLGVRKGFCVHSCR